MGSDRDKRENERATKMNAKIIVSEAEYKSAKNAEWERAAEEARGLAASIAVEVEVAESCSQWLQTPIVVSGTPAAADTRTDSHEKRIAAFTAKAKALQAARDANATKRGLPLGAR